ncbi:Amino acid transporter, partial [Gryllus bimaculatus]
MIRTVQYRDGTNTLGIIFFCLVFGTVLGHMGSKAHAVLDFFTTLDEAVMRIVAGVMLTPLGIASVVCGKVLAVADVALMARMLGWFVFTVALGVMIYQLILMQLIYLAILRRNPFRFYWQLAPATLTAFATASTAAALPVTLRCMDRDARIDPRVSRFVLPIGCTINMDGTALFVAVASGFLVQLSGVSFSLGDAITLCLAATAASFSSASVPSAALVLIFMVLATLDAPQSDVPLLFAVDWFVDRVRTTNNMLGDCYAAAVCRCRLQALDVLKPRGRLPRDTAALWSGELLDVNGPVGSPPVLAYADDLALLAMTPDEQQAHLNTAGKVLQRLNLRVKIGKCHIEWSRCVPTRFHTGGAGLPQVELGDDARNLRHRETFNLVEFWDGLKDQEAVTDIISSSAELN